MTADISARTRVLVKGFHHGLLGHTYTTKDLVQEKCDEWIRIYENKEWGDVVCVHKLLAAKLSKFEGLSVSSPTSPEFYWDRQTAPEDFQDFRMIMPINWGHDTQQRWEAGEAVADYAVVLRYTDAERFPGARVVQFIIAGFTEQGTEAAGEYLRANWMRLNAALCRKAGHASHGYGDFCMFITGRTKPAAGWCEVTGATVTPARIKVGWIWRLRARISRTRKQ